MRTNEIITCPKCEDKAQAGGIASESGPHGFVTVHRNGVPMIGCLHCGHTFK
jgi:predicted nucleic-acid-binding Zn-ribbon protein